jgi:hypothetical protein
MSAEAHHDPHAPFGGVTPQLRPERPRARCAKHVARGPSVASVIIRIARQWLPLAGQTRQLARLA